MPAILFLLFIALIILGPCFVIWALNTLFLLHIAYGVSQYFAALILMGLVGGFKLHFGK